MMSKPCERCKEWDDFYYWNHTNDEDKHFFKVILGDYRRGVSMPNKFVQNFNGIISETIKLEARNGSICDVKVAKNSESEMLLLSGHGWEAFVVAHDLRSTDFVVFRYCGDSHFKVLIFDASGCEKPSSCVSLNSAMMNSTDARQEEGPVQVPRSSGVDPRHPVRSPKREGGAQPRGGCMSRGKRIVVEVASSSSSGGRSDDATGGASSSEGDGGGTVQEADTRARSVRLSGCIFPRRTRLSRAEEAAVEEMVAAVGSELPLFGAVITNIASCRRRSCLTICREYAEKWLPAPGKDQTVRLRRDGTGRSWDVQLYHSVRSNGRRRLTLSRGWRQFVVDNGVRAGDICLFELLLKSTAAMVAMNVHVSRHGKHV